MKIVKMAYGAALLGAVLNLSPALAQAPSPIPQTAGRPTRSTPPARDPATPGYVTYVNQQWPYNAETPHGAWEFHEHLIPDSPAKPLRIWMEVGDRDLLNPNVMRDNMHDWVVANENMAMALAAKGYHYQFVFARNAGHTDAGVKQQTLPEALEWLWKDYKPETK